MTRRIVQITDLHLLPNPDERLRGVPTVKAVELVLEHLRENVPDIDLLVISGDLAQEESKVTYRRLAEMLEPWGTAIRMIPGNHDDREQMEKVFSALVTNAAERIVFAEQLDAWRVIGLDSLSPGEVAGLVGQQQLGWLDQQLHDHSDCPTIVFVHHPPVSVETSWFDVIGLQDAEAMREVIARHPQVKLVCCGHVHFEFESAIASTRVVTTPAASFQFAPHTPSQEYDLLPPGYRLIEVEGDEYRTTVLRLPELRHIPV